MSDGIFNVFIFEDMCMTLRQSAQPLHMHGQYLRDIYVNRIM